MPKSPFRLMITGPDSSQAPFAEHDGHHWRIWQSFNGDVTSGTYVILYSNGDCERHTVLNGDITDIVLLRNPQPLTQDL